MQVLITSPSIDLAKNVSGISNFTKLLLENNREVEYIHFIAGKADDEKRGIKWAFSQLLLIYSLISTLRKYNEVRLIHINMPFQPGAIIRDFCLLIISSVFRKKIVIHIHGGKFNLNPDIPFPFKWIIQKCLTKSYFIIVLGSSEKSFLLNQFRIDSSKVAVLQNSVIVPSPYPDNTFHSVLNILFIGRIEKNKGLMEMVKSLAMLKSSDYQFLIAGDGPEKAQFIKDCEAKIKGKYKYFGIVSGKKKIEILQKSHIFLLPSYYEGLPYALLEAMAWGLIPLVTKVGSIPEVIQDTENGYLFEVGDHRSIGQKLNELDGNRQLMKEISMNAYKTVYTEFNFDIYIQELNHIYQSAINPR